MADEKQRAEGVGRARDWGQVAANSTIIAASFIPAALDFIGFTLLPGFLAYGLWGISIFATVTVLIFSSAWDGPRPLRIAAWFISVAYFLLKSGLVLYAVMTID